MDIKSFAFLDGAAPETTTTTTTAPPEAVTETPEGDVVVKLNSQAPVDLGDLLALLAKVTDRPQTSFNMMFGSVPKQNGTGFDMAFALGYGPSACVEGVSPQGYNSIINGLHAMFSKESEQAKLRRLIMQIETRMDPRFAGIALGNQPGAKEACSTPACAHDHETKKFTKSYGTPDTK